MLNGRIAVNLGHCALGIRMQHNWPVAKRPDDGNTVVCGRRLPRARRRLLALIPGESVTSWLAVSLESPTN